ncbi:MAG: CDGSH iron-sulfur domain-containing protein [Gammaproteobacteria bacterium]|nr:CDGSH iron-sulfur domain-containing protein [Gammaproteobacteria bacterium]
MADAKIAQKGPYVQAMEPGTYYFCTCGQSRTQPFCDGAHKGSGFAPKVVEIETQKTVAWCGCKQSKDGAFCDGTHNSL